MAANDPVPSQHEESRQDEPVAGWPPESRYVLRLYVTGYTTRSVQAIAAVRHLCEKHLRGVFDLQVVDICQHPDIAEREQIVAFPTLVRERPLPLRKIVGDLTNEENTLLGLGLRRTT